MSADRPAPSPDNLDTLIDRCLGGDELAWAVVVRQHWRRVFNLAYKFVGRHADAEDLTQEVFLKVFRVLGTFDRRSHFDTWLVSVSRNLCIDHYRRALREREHVDRRVDPNELSPVSASPGPLAALEQRDRVALLRGALAALPPTLRQAVLLRDIRELSYAEIAERLHVPQGTVKSRINRGRAELARHVRRLGDRGAGRTRRQGPRAVVGHGAGVLS
jgi:RNA polymerase sigma-70 factor (ECF subfamily)